MHFRGQHASVEHPSPRHRERLQRPDTPSPRRVPATHSSYSSSEVTDLEADDAPDVLRRHLRERSRSRWEKCALFAVILILVYAALRTHNDAIKMTYSSIVKSTKRGAEGAMRGEFSDFACREREISFRDDRGADPADDKGDSQQPRADDENVVKTFVILGTVGTFDEEIVYTLRALSPLLASNDEIVIGLRRFFHHGEGYSHRWNLINRVLDSSLVGGGSAQRGGVSLKVCEADHRHDYWRMIFDENFMARARGDGRYSSSSITSSRGSPFILLEFGIRRFDPVGFRAWLNSATRHAWWRGEEAGVLLAGVSAERESQHRERASIASRMMTTANEARRERLERDFASPATLHYVPGVLAFAPVVSVWEEYLRWFDATDERNAHRASPAFANGEDVPHDGSHHVHFRSRTFAPWTLSFLQFLARAREGRIESGGVRLSSSSSSVTAGKGERALLTLHPENVDYVSLYATNV